MRTRRWQLVVAAAAVTTGGFSALTAGPAWAAVGCVVNGEFVAGTTINGTSGNDVIDCSGSEGAVTVNGGAGNDTIIGSEFSDVLHGGSGNDEINGGDFGDQLFGDSGNDRLDGGGCDLSRDTYNTGSGRDTVIFGLGQDDPSITNASGPDTVVIRDCRGED
jgi:Ca2+-binding RTX toxin-like protein